MNPVSALARWPKVFSLLLGFGLVPGVGFLDYLGGCELSFSAFYILPVFVLAWTTGLLAGLAGALASAAVRTLADLAVRHVSSSVMLFAGNAFMGLVLFAVMAVIFSSLKMLVDQQGSIGGTDRLTGAASSKAFQETLRMEMDRSRRYERPFTLAYFDLDDLESVNDCLGRSEGDAVLRTVVTAIRERTRKTDRVGRLGGDEFGVLLPETDREQACVAVKKLRDGILHDLRRRGSGATVSIGAFTVTDYTMDVETIIGKAGRLMIEAKLAARNATYYPLSDRSSRSSG